MLDNIYCPKKGGDSNMAEKSVSQQSKDRYLIEKVDSLIFRVPKGEKSVIQEHAKSQSESTNGFIYRAVKETMERDRQKQE